MFISKKIFILMLVLTVAPFLTSAQTGRPEFLVTWKANSFVESGFIGKAFPAGGSGINVKFELIDGVKVANISKNEVRWFIDGKLSQKGAGLKSITFNAAQFTNSHTVKILVAGYKGADWEKFITIPIKRGEVVIKASYPNNEISAGSHIFKALLYNWNISSKNLVLFNWLANDEDAPAGNDLDQVEVIIPPTFVGLNVLINVTAQDVTNDLAASNASLNLVVK